MHLLDGAECLSENAPLTLIVSMSSDIGRLDSAPIKLQRLFEGKASVLNFEHRCRRDVRHGYLENGVLVFLEFGWRVSQRSLRRSVGVMRSTLKSSRREGSLDRLLTRNYEKIFEYIPSSTAEGRVEHSQRGSPPPSAPFNSRPESSSVLYLASVLILFQAISRSAASNFQQDSRGKVVCSRNKVDPRGVNPVEGTETFYEAT